MPPSHHPRSLTSVSLVPALHLLLPSTPFWPYGTHPFFPHSQNISKLSDLLYSLTPIYYNSPTHFLIPNSIHSWHSNQTSQTLHLKNIHFHCLSTSHTPCLCSTQPAYKLQMTMALTTTSTEATSDDGTNYNQYKLTHHLNTTFNWYRLSRSNCSDFDF